MTALRGVRIVLVAALLAGPFVIAYFDGGYNAEPRLWAGLVACLLLAGGALAARRPLPASRPGRVALGGLALLALWTAASISWAPLSTIAVADTQRLLLYLVGFAAALALFDTRAAVRAVEPAVALGALAVVLYGLSERLLPGVFDLKADASALGRLSLPITYWNGMGSVAALGSVLATRLAGDVTRPRLMRAAAAAAVVPLGLGVWLSFSRGATAALVIGLLVLAALTRTAAQLRAFAIVVPAALVACVVAQSFDGVRALQGTLSARESDGAVALAVLVACCALAAAAQLLLARRERPGTAGDRPLTPLARRAIAGLLALVIAGGFVFTIAFSERSAQTPPSGATTKRLTSVESNRSAYWHVALNTFAHHPLRGVGSGGFLIEWLRHRKVADPAHDAHSLYVETAAELGIVGLIALALFIGGVIWAAVRAYARDPVPAAGLAAGLAVWLVHAGLDWLWELPAVSMPALLLAAALVRRADAPVAEPAVQPPAPAAAASTA